MEPNITSFDRSLRGAIGGTLLGIGLARGRRTWWGIALDLVGAVLLLSAVTGFCHVRKALGICSVREET